MAALRLLLLITLLYLKKYTKALHERNSKHAEAPALGRRLPARENPPHLLLLLTAAKFQLGRVGEAETFATFVTAMEAGCIRWS